VTKKGQGYELAEADPLLYHGPSKFNPEEGVKKAIASKKTFTQVFGEWLCDMAHADPLLVGITPAMREGSGLVEFEKNFPKRYYDVGIAEQHAVTFAAGMACEGMKPVVAIYSTFLQRAYDQLIHDVALQDLPVLFALDRAGLVGADGATHAGAYDIPFLRCVPNMLVMTPADEAECRDLLTTAFHQPHPSAVRYPRGAGIGAIPSKELRTLPMGKGEIRRKATAPAGQRVAILAFGTLLYPVLEVAEGIDATVANMRFVKPLDVDLIQSLAADHDYFVTIEDGAIAGGAGSACLEALANLGINKPLLQLGLPDQFIEHGDYNLLMTKCGLGVEGIANSIKQRFPAILTVNSVLAGK
jgi:1-deoxy-D-xylulose-5-phosphate synthase